MLFFPFTKRLTKATGMPIHYETRHRVQRAIGNLRQALRETIVGVLHHFGREEEVVTSHISASPRYPRIALASPTEQDWTVEQDWNRVSIYHRHSPHPSLDTSITQPTLRTVNVGLETPSTAVFSPMAPPPMISLQDVREMEGSPRGWPSGVSSVDEDQEFQRPVFDIDTNHISFCEPQDVVFTDEIHLVGPVSSSVSIVSSVRSPMPESLHPGYQSRQPRTQPVPTSEPRTRPHSHSQPTLPYIQRTIFRVPGLSSGNTTPAIAPTRKAPTLHDDDRTVSSTPSFPPEETTQQRPQPYGSDSSLCLTQAPNHFHFSGAVIGSVAPGKGRPHPFLPPPSSPIRAQLPRSTHPPTLSAAPLASHPIPPHLRNPRNRQPAPTTTPLPSHPQTSPYPHPIRPSPESEEFPIRNLRPSATARREANRARAQWRCDHIWTPLRRVGILPTEEQEELDERNQERVWRAVRRGAFGDAWSALGDLVFRRKM